MAAVVTIFVTASKPLAEVVVVVGPVYIIAAVPEVGVPISVGVFVIGAPMVVPVRLAGAEAFLIPVVRRPPQHFRAVFVGLVVAPAAIVAIDRRRIEIGVAIVVESMVPEMDVLLTQALQILFLKTKLRRAILSLEQRAMLLRETLLLLQMMNVLRHALLLLTDTLLLLPL